MFSSAEEFADTVVSFAQQDTRLRDALRTRTEQLRDLATAIDQLDPRTRK